MCLRKSLSVDATATFLRAAQPRDTASSTQAALKPHLGLVPSNASNKLKPRNTGKPHETCPQQKRRLSNRKSAHDLSQKRPRSWSSQTFPRKPVYAPNQQNPNPAKNHQATCRPKQEKHNPAQRLKPPIHYQRASFDFRLRFIIFVWTSTQSG